MWGQRLSFFVGGGGGVYISQVDRDGEKMLELPPSLGLGTIYMVPLRGRTSLTTKVWVWSSGMGMGRC